MTLNERPTFRNALVSATPPSRDTDPSRGYSAARSPGARWLKRRAKRLRTEDENCRATPHDDERSPISLPH
jgi:hypothetical protein